MAEVFQLKRFSVRHSDSEVKVGTDGLILGAVSTLFAQEKGASQILDIGTGTGIVALMLAGTPGARVTALEIDERSAEEAAENARRSPFAERITVLHTDYLQYRTSTAYDLIVSNPPYYTATHSAEYERRTLAKHIGRLTPDALFARVAKHLTEDGYLLLILPTNAVAQFEQKGRPHGLQMHGSLFVRTVAGKAPKRAVLFWHRRIPSDCFIDTLTIANPDGSYTDQYRRLMQPYLFI